MNYQEGAIHILLPFIIDNLSIHHSNGTYLSCVEKSRDLPVPGWV